MCECGISSITLEGSLEDWEKIKAKFEFFSKKEFGLKCWIPSYSINLFIEYVLAEVFILFGSATITFPS